jgi:hypothetical protein
MIFSLSTYLFVQSLPATFAFTGTIPYKNAEDE